MYRLRNLGYEIEPGKSGAPEIKGYSQEYLDASSPRSRQIREYMERNGVQGHESAQIAAHSTRDRKEILSPAEVLDAHRRLAAEFGNQPNTVVRAARERIQNNVQPTIPDNRAQESLTFSRDKNFEREAVIDDSLAERGNPLRLIGKDESPMRSCGPAQAYPPTHRPLTSRPCPTWIEYRSKASWPRPVAGSRSKGLFHPRRIIRWLQPLVR